MRAATRGQGSAGSVVLGDALNLVTPSPTPAPKAKPLLSRAATLSGMNHASRSPAPTSKLSRAATCSALRGSTESATSESFKKKVAQVDKIRAQLETKSGDGDRACLIHPIESKLLPWWDFCTTVALVFTATITPWETAFVNIDPSTNPWTQPWFITNRIIDFIFIADVSFRLSAAAARAADKNSTSFAHRRRR